MEETRKYIAKSLEEQVCEENQSAGLSVEQYARHKGLIESSSIDEGEFATTKSEEEPIEGVSKKELEKEDLSVDCERLKTFERGLYAISGSIVFLALVYLGTYIHSVINIEKTQVIDAPGIFYHYESEHMPYHNEGILFKDVPYELEKYLFRQMIGM